MAMLNRHALAAAVAVLVPLGWSPAWSGAGAPVMSISADKPAINEIGQVVDPSEYGYSFDQPTATGEIVLRRHGEIVWQLPPDRHGIGGHVSDARDRTNNGLPNVEISLIESRSTRGYIVLELGPDGVRELIDVSAHVSNPLIYVDVTGDGILTPMLAGDAPWPGDGHVPPQHWPSDPIVRPGAPDHGGSIPDTDGALAALDQALAVDEGFWGFSVAGDGEPFRARLGWIDPAWSPTEYAAMLFRCPVDDGPHSLDLLSPHDRAGEVPATLTFVIGDNRWRFEVTPLYDEGLYEAWFATTEVPRGTDLFAAMATGDRLVVLADGKAAATLPLTESPTGIGKSVEQYLRACGA